MITGFILFFLAGLGFGFAAQSGWKWLALGIPVLLALLAVMNDGFDATILLKLLAALVVTAGGVLLGIMLQERQRRPERRGGTAAAARS